MRDRLLWRLVKGQRTAVAVAREISGYGLELRIEIDGELRWSQMIRHGQGLEAESAAKRQALEALGWCAAPQP
jgi:hypothetical protein